MSNCTARFFLTVTAALFITAVFGAVISENNPQTKHQFRPYRKLVRKTVRTPANTKGEAYKLEHLLSLWDRMTSTQKEAFNRAMDERDEKLRMHVEAEPSWMRQDFEQKLRERSLRRKYFERLCRMNEDKRKSVMLAHREGALAIEVSKWPEWKKEKYELLKKTLVNELASDAQG